MTGFDRAQAHYESQLPPYLEAEELDDDPDVLDDWVELDDMSGEG